jgi:hypothetical protein
VEADAGTEAVAYLPGHAHASLELGVVVEREVLLEAERRRHEVNLQVQRLAEREHDGQRLRRGETRELVDR